MVARRKKKYETGEASNFVSRKQAMRKLQLNLKVRNRIESKVTRKEIAIIFSRIFDDYAS